MSKYPTIPDFSDSDLQSVATAVRALKLAFEVVAGQRQGESLGAPEIYVQGFRPDVAQDETRRNGELWFNTTTDKLYVWVTGFWLQVLV